MKNKYVISTIVAGIWNIVSTSTYSIIIIGDESQREASLQRAQEFSEVVMIQKNDFDEHATATFFKTSQGKIGLLTAAHCVYHNIDGEFILLTSFLLLKHKGGRSYKIDPTNSSVYSFTTPEDLESDDFAEFKDLALVTFENPLEVLEKLEISIEVLPTLRPPLSHLEILEDFQRYLMPSVESYQIVGFGRQGHAELHEDLSIMRSVHEKATHKAYMEAKVRMSEYGPKFLTRILYFSALLRSQHYKYFDEDLWKDRFHPILSLKSLNPSKEEIDNRELVGFLEPGDSGAPLFHSNGARRELIGVVSSRNNIDMPHCQAGEGEFCYLLPYLEDIHNILEPETLTSGSASSDEQALSLFLDLDILLENILTLT